MGSPPTQSIRRLFTNEPGVLVRPGHAGSAGRWQSRRAWRNEVHEWITKGTRRPKDLAKAWTDCQVAEGLNVMVEIYCLT